MEYEEENNYLVENIIRYVITEIKKNTEKVEIKKGIINAGVTNVTFQVVMYN